MNPFRRPRPAPADSRTDDRANPRTMAGRRDSGWADTLPSVPPRDFSPTRSMPLPVIDTLDGVDVNELESQTVFDQFFGEPMPPRR